MIADLLWSGFALLCVGFSSWHLIRSVVTDVRRDRASRRTVRNAHQDAGARPVEACSPEPAAVAVTRIHRFADDREGPRLMLAERVRSSATFFVLENPGDAVVGKRYLVCGPNPAHDEVVQVSAVSVARGVTVSRALAGTFARRHPAGVELLPLAGGPSRFREGLR